MSKAARLLILLALIVLLSPPAADARPSADQSAVPAIFVRVFKADLAGRPLPTALRQIDHGAFWWLELDAAALARLEAGGAPFQRRDDAAEVIVGGYRFDTRRGEPALPAELRAPADAQGLHLLQLTGPARPDWLAALRAAGLQLVTPLAPFNLIVWGRGLDVSQAAALDFVRWSGPFHPAYKLAPGLAESDLSLGLKIALYDDGDPAPSLAAIEAAAGQPLTWSRTPGRLLRSQVFLSRPQVAEIARLPHVYSISAVQPGPYLRDEMSDQIVADNHPGGEPQVGYYDWLAGKGVSGQDIRIANVDTGVDFLHQDINGNGQGRVICLNYQPNSYPPPACGVIPPICGNHGTHTAGIMLGDGSSGASDPSGFLLGLGVAPQADLLVQNFLCSAGGGSAPPATPDSWLELSKDAIRQGASVSGNSWGPAGTPQGYDDDTRIFDIMPRDGDPGLAGNQPIDFVLSIMNGGGGLSSQGTPDEAKNLLRVGASKNRRAGDIDDLCGCTAHGPALDGRLLPDLVAPGESVQSTLPGNSHGSLTGTSMASPHVSGGVALFQEWYRSQYGALPSPALTKGAMIVGADDLAFEGGLDADRNPMSHVPNNQQGWGRMNLDNTVNPNAAMVYLDQAHVFGQSGESWSLPVYAADSSQPLKISLVWTDAPGPGLGGGTPAWINDLDLVVSGAEGVYLGNVFSGGWSTTGGSADFKNNVENVYLPTSGGDAYQITVYAANIVGDGIPGNDDATDQDFALVVWNGTLGAADFDLQVAPRQQSLCLPGSLDYAVTVEALLGFTATVSLGLADLPGGAGGSFEPPVVAPPAQSTLTLDLGEDVPAGDHIFVIVGAHLTTTHQITASFAAVAGPPAAPTLLAPADGVGAVSRNPILSWTETAAASQSYRLQLGLDPGFNVVVLDAAELPESHYTVADPLLPGTTFYWRVRSTNICGDGAWSAVHSFTVQPQACLLLVDDDNASPNVEGLFTAPLNALDVSYDLFQVGAGAQAGPDAGQLSGYAGVVWFSGDKRGSLTSPAAGPNGADEAALAQYLALGGRLFLSSQDYLHDRGLNSFGRTYLGVDSFDDGGANAATAIVGRSGDPIGAGFGSLPLSYPIGWSKSADEINPGAAASMAFRSNLSTEGAVLDVDGDAWRTVFAATPFEAVAQANPANAEALLSRILDWFGPCQASYWADEDQNCQVTVADVMQVSTHWNTTLGDPNYDFAVDQDADGDVDLWDIVLTASQWGWTC